MPWDFPWHALFMKKDEFAMHIPPVIFKDNPFVSPELFEEEHRQLVGFYVAIASRFFLLSNRFAKVTVKQFNALTSSLNSYRKSVNRDSSYSAAAANFGFITHRLSFAEDDLPLSLSNLGIFCSTNPKDLKFAVKVLRTFVKKTTPDFHVEDFVPPEPNHFHDVPDTIMVDVRLPVNGKLRLGNLDSIIGMAHELTADERRATKKALEREGQESIALACLVMGRDARPGLERLYSTSFSEEVLHKMLTVILCPLTSIFFCSPDFWAPMVNALMLHSVGDAQSSDNLSEQQIMPLFKACQMRIDALCDMNSRLLSKCKSLEQQLENTVPPHSDGIPVQELEELQSVIQTLQREAEVSKHEYDLCLERANNLAAQVNDLTHLLNESKAAITVLNNQLIDAYTGSGVFYDDVEGVDSDTQSPSGLSQRLGESGISNLQEKQIMIIGGHSNTHTVLRNLFPDWECVGDLKVTPKYSSARFDAIVFITSYCSHNSFEAAKTLSKTLKIPLILCPKTSPFGICEKINAFCH